MNGISMVEFYSLYSMHIFQEDRYTRLTSTRQVLSPVSQLQDTIVILIELLAHSKMVGLAIFIENKLLTKMAKTCFGYKIFSLHPPGNTIGVFQKYAFIDVRLCLQLELFFFFKVNPIVQMCSDYIHYIFLVRVLI